MNALRHAPLGLVGLLLALSLALLSGCKEKAAKAQGQGGNAPPEVAIVTIAPERVVFANELPGRVEATRVAQVRARVAGIVEKRMFREGSDVKAGDVLFRIDPAPFEAAYSSTLAGLARAEANLAQANLKVERFKPLVQSSAISRQEYDDALTTQKQAQADVATAKAARDTAKLNLGYATVTAPIAGRIGRALVTEGALVGQNEATPMALIQQMDPVYVTMTQSSAELTRLQRSLESGQLKAVGKDAAQVTLVDESGQPYGKPGKLLFSEMNVDEATGSVILRAQFPNPDRRLLPGMYARARLEQGVNEQAITVPQQAVQRTVTGASVLLVNAEGKVAAQPIKTSRAQGNGWVVSDGLKAGDRVIVEGLQKAKPGEPVKTVPWKSSASDANPAPEASPAKAVPAPVSQSAAKS